MLDYVSVRAVSAAIDFYPGIGRAVADRTVARLVEEAKPATMFVDIQLPRNDATSLDDQVNAYCKANNLKISGYLVTSGDDVSVEITLYVIATKRRETWTEVAERVALGNCSLSPKDFRRELAVMTDHMRRATVLMSGRHLQHGDADQAKRVGDVYQNCATASTTFLSFYLLLNGAGVGRDYSDDIILADFANAPIVVPVIEWGHSDVEKGLIQGYMTRAEAEHLYVDREITVFEVPDSREGWAEAIAQIEIMAWQRRRNQVLLIDFTGVRPHGSPIKGMQGRPASGPAPMMSAIINIAKLRDAGMPAWRSALYADHYLAAVVLVGGARRAARMSTKFWRDPDILDFIGVKAGGKFLWSSNNSVTVDAEFWNLVREGRTIRKAGSFELSDDQAWAEQVYDAVVEAAYHDGTGEPGFINVDKFDSKLEVSFEPAVEIINPTRLKLPTGVSDYVFATAKVGAASKYPMITNPCVTADTWVQTGEGPRRVADLIGKPFEARVDGQKYDSVKGFWKTGDKQVYRIKTARGFEVRATDNHKFLIEVGRRRKLGGGYNLDREWIELKNIKLGDRIVLDRPHALRSDPGAIDFQRGWLLGEIVGDGGYNPSSTYAAYLRFWGGNAEEMAARAESFVRATLDPDVRFGGARYNATNKTWQVGSAALDRLCDGFIEPVTKAGTDALEEASEDFVAGFLRGLFDADGSVQGSTHKGVSVRLGQSDLSRLKMAQRMLLRLGVLSTIYEDRRVAGTRALPDGNGGSKVYEAKAQHELVISNASVEKFERTVGFFDPAKAGALGDTISNRRRALNEDDFTSEVVEIVEDGVEAVYDCTVEDVHRFSANGLVAHNCGEVQIIKWGGYCCLADVAPFHANDLNDAEAAFRVATRALVRANLMDFLYRAEVKRTNRIGVGMTGLFEFALKFFGYGFRDLIDEEKSKDFWLTIARFSQAVKDEAKRYAKKLGVTVPHTDTTQKPSGTISKLFGLTEGAHLPAMLEYLRWVQFRNDDPLVAEYQAKGYPIKKLRTYEGTTVVGFPTTPLIVDLAREMGLEHKLVTASEASPAEQFQWLKLMEKYWIRGELEVDTGNQISYTLKYRPDQVSFDEFSAMMLEHMPDVKCASVMPQVDTTAYEYQPEQGVKRAEFEMILAQINATSTDKMEESVDYEHLACEGGSCPIDFSKAGI